MRLSAMECGVNLGSSMKVKQEKLISDDIKELEKLVNEKDASSFYDSMFALTGWKTVEINGIEFELNSILVEKWKGKPSPFHQKNLQFGRAIQSNLNMSIQLLNPILVSE